MKHRCASGRSFWLAACLAPLLAACAAGPDFRSPSVPSVAGLTATPLPGLTTGGPSTSDRPQQFVDATGTPAEWWRGYGSEQLDALVTQALRQSPTIASAEAALRQASALAKEQRSAFLPSVGLTAGPTRARVSNAIASPVSNGASIYTLQSVQVSVGYSVDVFGAARRSAEAADAQRDTQAWQLRAAQLSLAGNVVTAAIQWASLQDQLEATVRLQEISKRQWELLLVQRRLGESAGALVLVQESLLRQVESAVASLERQIAQQRDQLAALVGTVPSDPAIRTVRLADLTLPDVPTRLPAKVLSQRPDVEVALAQVHFANANVGVAVANMLPQISLTADYGSSALGLAQLFRASGLFWSVGAGVAQPIFEGQMLSARKDAAQAQLEQTLAQYSATVLGAFQNVADSLEAARHDADVYTAALRQETLARTELHIVGRQHEFGDVSMLPVLAAEVAYRQAQLARVQALASRHSDVAAAYVSVGGPWQVTESATGDPGNVTMGNER